MAQVRFQVLLGCPSIDAETALAAEGLHLRRTTDLEGIPTVKARKKRSYLNCSFDSGQLGKTRSNTWFHFSHS